MLILLVVFLCAYLMASISPSIIVCKAKTGKDIRELGSGNAGTTNALRVLGKKLGVLVFLLDVLKVVIAYGVVYFIAKISNYSNIELINSVFIFSAVLGHCYPIYYGFKGGKGVAVILTCAMIINYKLTLIALVFAIIMILITRMVSVGSVTGLILFNVLIFIKDPAYIIPVVLTSTIVIFKHRKNIQRIFQNKENKLF